jgi:hypothetical protein
MGNCVSPSIALPVSSRAGSNVTNKGTAGIVETLRSAAACDSACVDLTFRRHMDGQDGFSLLVLCEGFGGISGNADQAILPCGGLWRRDISRHADH